ncbi:unnamed protein product [Adineta steineri]|uniref:Uncharacterized protein n=1 Tax=Adineta steineri TaxID=433720 RepID=A0A813R7Q5_9BILA|nr:unnamed protein product [Adineta steineri]
MNRIVIVIRYRTATHVGLTSSFTQNFVQVVYIPINKRYIQKPYKSCEDINHLFETFKLSNNFAYQQYPIRMSSLSSSQLLNPNSKQLSNEDLSKETFDDNNEISTLINLLILRVECLSNKNTLIEKKKQTKIYPTIKQIDQNLTEYLYYLFNKFTKDDPDICTSMIDKTNFVNVCQTLVRNGCFNMPLSTSPEQSLSESTLTNNNELTLTQTCLREYRTDVDDLIIDKSTATEETSSISMNDQDTWLIVDLEPIKPQYSTTIPDESKCLLPTSTSDDQLLLANENYFSFEEIKSSCGSESSQSNYYSPNSSLVDLQNMVQEYDEINNNHNNNNNNNNNNLLFHEDGSSSPSIDHTSNNPNVILEEKDNTSNNDICTGLTNDNSNSSNEQVVSSSLSSLSSSMETTDQMTMNLNAKKFRREKKMQERWTVTTKNDDNQNNGQSTTKAFLGVEFPPIAVLRRKFSILPPQPTILNPLPIKRKDSSSLKTKIQLNNPSQDNIDTINNQISSTQLNPSISLNNQEINTSTPPSTTTVPIIDKTKCTELDDIQLNDVSSIINQEDNNNTIQQSSSIHHAILLKTDMTIENKDELCPTILNKNEKELMKNINNDIGQEKNNNSIVIPDVCTSNSTVSSSSSTSSSMINSNEIKPNELLLKEIEEEEKKDEEEEQQQEAYYHNDNVDIEQENNTNVEPDYHASGILLTNDEPIQTLVLEQEKKRTTINTVTNTRPM